MASLITSGTRALGLLFCDVLRVHFHACLSKRGSRAIGYVVMTVELPNP